VKDLIFVRVGSLATEERNLLDVAACAGFEFDPVLVGEVLHVGRYTLTVLEADRRRILTVRITAAGDTGEEKPATRTAH